MAQGVTCMRVGVVINPKAGGHRGLGIGDRVSLVHEAFRRVGVDGPVMITKRRGHGREVARAWVKRGVDTIVVWGGDGTINEVASQLVLQQTTLGIVPAGSGNGLARELCLYRDPARALEVALNGQVRRIDVGELGGHPFFNVAGLGLDAHLAAIFNASTRRGVQGYITGLFRALRTHRPQHYAVQANGFTVKQRALMVAFANTRQYGNGAVIAAVARPDDGLLELVVVPSLPTLTLLWQARRFFTGSVHDLHGVRTYSIREGQITGNGPLTFHVDGEVVTGPKVLALKLHPGALTVRVGRRL